MGLWQEAISATAVIANRACLPTLSTHALVKTFQDKQSPCTLARIITKVFPSTAQVDVPHLTAVDEAGQASNVGARLV